MGFLAARTTRIRLGTAVVTLPLYDPIRVVENMAFVDVLSGDRVVLGLGSGYRPYEFEGFGRDFDGRRNIQEEAIDLILELVHKRRVRHQGTPFRFGLMLSTLRSADTLAKQIALYRNHLKGAPGPLDRNPAAGKVDIARWVYVADSDAAARRGGAQLRRPRRVHPAARLTHDSHHEAPPAAGEPVGRGLSAGPRRPSIRSSPRHAAIAGWRARRRTGETRMTAACTRKPTAATAIAISAP